MADSPILLSSDLALPIWPVADLIAKGGSDFTGQQLSFGPFHLCRSFIAHIDRHWLLALITIIASLLHGLA